MFRAVRLAARAALVAVPIVAVGGTSAVISINDEWDSVFPKQSPPVPEGAPKERIVILGTGWAALETLRKLDTSSADVTIVSPRPFFFYTPLLAGATVGTVDKSSIVEPIRAFCSRTNSEHATYIQAIADSVDFENKVIHCSTECFSNYGDPVAHLPIKYDKLVVSVGAQTATFGIKGVEEHALFMKEVDDAAIAQQRILETLERADTLIHAGAPKEIIDNLLHIVVVGAGPTGVELSAELSDFIRSDVNRLFPQLKGRVRVTLLEAMGRVLAPFNPEVAEFAAQHLQNEGVAVRCNTAVQVVTSPTSATIGPGPLLKGVGEKEDLKFGLLVWAAGIATRPLTSQLIQTIGAEKGQDNRRGLVVDDKLRVQGVKDVYALGDCAWSGNPPTAQVAAQQGKWLGRRLRDRDLDAAEPFGFTDQGKMAYIGNKEAVAQLKTPLGGSNTSDHFWWRLLAFENDEQSLKGGSAFLFWRSVYFSKMLSSNNRLKVGYDWCKAETTGRDVAMHQALLTRREVPKPPPLA